MHILSDQIRSRRNARLLLIAVPFTVLLLSDPTRADYTGSGDITDDTNGTLVDFDPFIGEPGNRNDGDETSQGDLVVGDRGVAGIFGDDGLPFLDFVDLKPLRSDFVIIGNQAGSEGSVSLEGFQFLSTGNPGSTAPYGGNWLIEDDFTIGNNGEGSLSLRSSARIEVAGDTRIGGGGDQGGGIGDPTAGVGLGLVTINGEGSRLVTGFVRDTSNPETGIDTNGSFIIGYDAEADVLVSGRATIESLGDAIVGQENGANGVIRLAERRTRWTIDGTLFVGNGNTGTTSALGRIEIADDALLQAEGPVQIHTLGAVNLYGGTLKMVPTTGSIVNNGDILGDGLIHAGINNMAAGKIRNQSALVQNANIVTNVREKLTVTGPVVNAGLIESIGGEMVFQSAVNGGGDVVARNAIVRFDGGFAGSGNLILGGGTTVYGNISSGTVVVTGGPVVTVHGNVNFVPGPLLAAASDGDLAAAMDAGPGFDLTIAETAALVIDGNLNLGGVASLTVNYEGANSLEVGDLVSAISVTGGITGEFTDAKFISDGRFWDIIMMDDEVQVMAGALVLPGAGDFDLDGDVDGGDFLTWQRSSGDSDNLLVWQYAYGTESASLSAASTAVPEPSTIMLAMLTLACCPRRRPRT